MDGGVGSLGLPDYVLKDLSKSGLVPEDLNIRVVDNPERAVTLTPFSVHGYVLPYFSIRGRLLPFYRVRLFDSDAKYRQPKDSQNHVYFPKGFTNLFATHAYVVITEGEKKAGAAVKMGFPCCALGGVDSWRNRTILLAGDADLKAQKNKLAVKLPAGGEVVEDYSAPLAIGLTDLIDACIAQNKQIIVCFDTDTDTTHSGCPAEVQRAAAGLGYELRFRGVPFKNIKQLVLPALKGEYTQDKVGLDDYLVFAGKAPLQVLLDGVLKKKSAFPQHPNVREYINRRLQKGSLSRKEIQSVSLAVLSDLDSRGLRLKDITSNAYFFDYRSKKLLKTDWATNSDGNFDSPFTQFMYKEYGLSGADHRLIQWLGTQFASEEPIEQVSPWRVFARPESSEDEDSIYYQISDSQYVKLTSTGLTLHDNGENNVLFESEQVDPLDAQLLFREFAKQKDEELTCWWASTLSQVRLRDKDKQRVIASLLYYMSPWLFRWRGMQLPIELIVGESGSGKSTLCELRLDILTGRPLLRNSPSDLKDWHASITNAGGLHVTDNVQLVDKMLRQRLSDEICRIVTEPDPFIEQRKYYTNADILRIPVRVVFALTAIQQPFQNADLIQRAFILELDKSLDQSDSGLIRYDSKWKANQLGRRGGREGWIAHHLVVLQRFFALVKVQWKNDYQAKQRLINFEQAMLTLAQVFGIPAKWIPDYLVHATDAATSDADWILEGLHAFAVEHQSIEFQNKKFRVSTISEWSEGQDEYKGCDMLVNPRKLGRYLRARKSAIFQLTGIAEAGTESNRVVYRLKGKPLMRKDYGVVDQ